MIFSGFDILLWLSIQMVVHFVIDILHLTTKSWLFISVNSRHFYCHASCWGMGINRVIHHHGVDIVDWVIKLIRSYPIHHSYYCFVCGGYSVIMIISGFMVPVGAGFMPFFLHLSSVSMSGIRHVPCPVPRAPCRAFSFLYLLCYTLEK
jgi:hypothetical protein